MIRHVFDAWHRFWALSWWWKGPTLAVIPLISLTIGLGLFVAAGGDSDTTVLEVTLKPSPTSTGAEPSPTAATSLVPTTTSEAPQAVTSETAPLPEPTHEAPAQQAPPAQQPPSQPAQPPVAQPTDPPQPPPPPPPAPTPEATVVDLETLCASAAQVAGDDLTELVRTIIGSEPIAQQFGKDVTSNYNDLCMLGVGYVSPGVLCTAAASDTDDVIPKGPGDTSSPTIYERLVEICLAYFS